MLRAISQNLITCEVLYWALITRLPALRWCSEICSREMDCYWSVTTPLPSQEVRATVLMRSKEVLLQQQYFMPPLTCKQLRQVLTSSLPQLTPTPLMPLLLPLAFRPGSSNILTKLPATLLPTLKHCAGYTILRMLLMCRQLCKMNLPLASMPL